MAAMRATPKDIGNYEAKLIGPFTQRQTVCLGIGLIPTITVAFLAKGAGMDVYGILALALLFMAIPGFLAFGQKLTHGMKPEDFVIDYYQYHIKSSKIRLYQTTTLDDKLVIEKQEAEEKLKNRSKKYREKAAKKKQREEMIKKKAEGTRFLSPKYKPYPHKASKAHRGYR